MGYANIELIEHHKLSVIYSDKGDVWHVISPFVDKDTPRFSATDKVLRVAIAAVMVKIEENK